MIKEQTSEHELLLLKASRGIALPLYQGQEIIIENSAGSQVVDTWAVNRDNPLEYSAMEHTRSLNSNIFFEQGMQAFSSLRRPMFTLSRDETPGRHDTLLCPCSEELYQQLGVKEYHRSCSDNFHEALNEVGIELSFTPASLNLFMNVPFKTSGELDRAPPVSKAFDRITLTAEMNIWLVLSACPQDITPINGASRTPQDIALYIKKGSTDNHE
ncbi:DUF1989 domain-containing protein [Pantoea sp. BAV 3049]|uniref:DUF1989 domain-containing protein n=1 Tax=Pantoea sp. BAV 3049 TaxID=2654188 RepID=UPI00131D3B35|nr:urea carboxylase-associated family protein [Pantoea sp. BAV 3049]